MFILGSHVPAMDAAHCEAKRNVSGTVPVVQPHLGHPSPVSRGQTWRLEEVTVLLSVCLQDRHSRGKDWAPGLSTLRLPRAVFGQQVRAGGSWVTSERCPRASRTLPSLCAPLAVFLLEAAS